MRRSLWSTPGSRKTGSRLPDIPAALAIRGLRGIGALAKERVAMAEIGRGLILDRDGVINEDTGYLHRAEECRFVDGIFELTAAFAARGFAVAIASNQSGIG